MRLKEKLVGELVAVCLALTMVGCGFVSFFAFFGVIDAMIKANPGALAISVVCMVVGARVTTITYRPTRARWKK